MITLKKDYGHITYSRSLLQNRNHVQSLLLLRTLFVKVLFVMKRINDHIEDITCPRVDMNFIFERSVQLDISQVKKKRDLLSSHNDGDLFTCEGNMLFSLVKI